MGARAVVAGGIRVLVVVMVRVPGMGHRRRGTFHRTDRERTACDALDVGHPAGRHERAQREDDERHAHCGDAKRATELHAMSRRREYANSSVAALASPFDDTCEFPRNVAVRRISRPNSGPAWQVDNYLLARVGQS